MPARKKMPEERPAVTKKFRIGDFKCYATVGLLEDGTPGEVFLVSKRVGSFERGLCNALAVMISLSLQHGVPLGKIVEKLELMAFEPSGVTGDKEFPLVKSLPDYIAKWLRSRWLAKEPCK